MLRVQDLRVSFSRYSGLLQRSEVLALDGVDVEVRRGELLALVGQSGAGKSLLAHAVLGVLPRNARLAGQIEFEGRPLDAKRQRLLRGRRMALVPQAVTWLDPSATAGRQVRWGASAAGSAADWRSIEAEFARYGLAREAMALFSHQLSGGMARRVLTAVATIARADLLIADEPTTGLDPQVRALALQLLRRLADQGHAVLVISHDLSAVLAHSDRVAILHAGRTVELAPAQAFATGQVQHPYTRALRSALPVYGFSAMPTPAVPLPHGSAGCLHRLECNKASTRCSEHAPPWVELDGARVRCHHV